MENEKHLWWHAFGELPAWQKVAIVFCGVITSPFLGLLAVVSAVSMFPFFLFGLWEGELGKAPLEHEVLRVAHHARANTRHYYDDAPESVS
ncbi:MAG TPA: hypothetical protein VGH87_22840 [Polyangiaceae bacterium]|jgi:hypothetical protein|nr:hypothetical protein [Polyangiaceae bacterium]